MGDKIGLTLPAGTRSRATNLQQPGYVIDTTSGDPFEPGISRDEFLRRHDQRYGAAVQSTNPSDGDFGVHLLADISRASNTLHSPEVQAALENVAVHNPGWLAERGYGRATGATAVELQSVEVYDAYFGVGVGEALVAESRRIDQANGSADARNPSAPPPPAPPVDHHVALSPLALQTIAEAPGWGAIWGPGKTHRAKLLLAELAHVQQVVE